MASVHLKSGAGNVSPYVDWTNAATTLAAAVAAMAAGDSLNVSNAHAEATAGISVSLPGSPTAVTKILGGVQAAGSGLSSLGSGAVIESTTASFIVGGSFYAANITWKGSSTSAIQAQFAATSGNIQHHKDCRFEITGANSNGAVRFGTSTGGAGTLATVKNCVFKFSQSAQRIYADSNVVIQGGSIDAAGTAISAVFVVSNYARGTKLICDDFDASACTSAADIIGTSGQGGFFAKIRRIKLPSGWSGGLVAAGQLKAGDRAEMVDFSSGSTLYKLWIADYSGSIREENTVKVTGQNNSYKHVTTANCGAISPLRSQEYYVNLTAGVAKTISIDILTDNVTLTDAEAWIEVDTLAAAGSSQGSITSDAVASIIDAPASQATSATAWTTTGLATPVKQTLSVSVTPGQTGYAIVRVVMAKPSTTVYVADQVSVA